MAGWTTNGVQPVSPLVVNGVTVSPPPLTNLDGYNSQLPCDTELGGGQQPQTVNVSPFQIACEAMALVSNQQTSTTHAATSNTTSCFITTEALNTAPGALYTFQFTNSLMTLTSEAPEVQVHNGTNTGGKFQINSVTNVSGGCVIVIQNIGLTAFNGTILIGVHA